MYVHLQAEAKCVLVSLVAILFVCGTESFSAQLI